MVWRTLVAAFIVACSTTLPLAQAEDPITIEQLQADPESYHARTVALRGTVFQIHQYRGGYTFILADDTGFQQVQASPVWTTQGQPVSLPLPSDGEQVEIQAYVTVSVQIGKAPGSRTLDRTIRVAAGTVRRLRD